MTVRNLQLGGSDFISGEVLYAADLNDTFDEIYDKVNGDYGTGSTDGLLNAPLGTIIPWLKSLSGTPSIPAGWAECDGTGGTPDLQTTSRMLRGTDSSTGGTGGSTTHTHTGADPGYGGNTNDFTNSMTTVSNLPPYYTVVWIIKIGE